MDTKEEVKQETKEAAREAKPWVVWLARLGYAAKGAVYMIVGVLAIQAALGTGGQTTDTSGALREIYTRPFGQVLLVIVTVGLLGYALWRFIQAALDPENKGSDVSGIVYRISYAVRGIAYILLAFTAFQLLTGSGGGGSTSSEELWTARVMAAPLGRWIIGLVGLIVIGAALAQVYLAFTADFMDRFKTHEMSETEETWAKRSGQFGLAARGVVFGLVGIFLIQAAMQYDPQEAGGLQQALVTLAQQPYGAWLLGIVALGLFAYGIYALVLARYRRIYF